MTSLFEASVRSLHIYCLVVFGRVNKIITIVISGFSCRLFFFSSKIRRFYLVIPKDGLCFCKVTWCVYLSPLLCPVSEGFVSLWSPSLPAVTEGYVGALQENRHGSSAQIRRRKASGDPYWAYSGELSCLDGHLCQGTLCLITGKHSFHHILNSALCVRTLWSSLKVESQVCISLRLLSP